MKTRFALGTILILVLAAAAVAGRTPATPEPTTPELAAAVRPLDLTPLHQEIRQLQAQEAARVEALVTRIGQEQDPRQVIELQRDVEAAKRDARLAVLGAQLRYARQEGRTEAVAGIETALEALRTKGTVPAQQ